MTTVGAASLRATCSTGADPAPAPRTALSPSDASDARATGLDVDVGELPRLELADLRLRWRNHLGGSFPAHLPNWLLTRVLAYRLQAAVRGSRRRDAARIRGQPDGRRLPRRRDLSRAPFDDARRHQVEARRAARSRVERQMVRVMVFGDGFAWNGETYSSLSQVARAITGTIGTAIASSV